MTKSGNSECRVSLQQWGETVWKTSGVVEENSRTPLSNHRQQDEGLNFITTCYGNEWVVASCGCVRVITTLQCKCEWHFLDVFLKPRVCLSMHVYMCTDHNPGTRKTQEVFSIMCQAEATAAAN